MLSTKPVRPDPRPEVMAIDAYVPGKSAVAGLAKVHKLSSNESPLGASPRAIEAFRANADQLAIYPDGSSRLLREAIAKRYGLDAEQIICGNGSDELLSLLAHVYLRPGDEGLYSQYGFLEYPIAIRAAGGTAVSRRRDAPARPMSTRCSPGDGEDQDRLPRQSQQPDRHVSAVRRGQAPARRSARRRRCWCSTPPTPNTSRATTTPPASSWSSTSENVVMTRTFSKIYGLAGLRLGWAYGAGAHRRRAEPHPRAVQRQRRGDRRRRRGARGRGPRRRGGRAQRALAAVARRRDRQSSGSR